MTTPPTTSPIVVAAGEGRRIPGPEGITVKASGTATAGSVGVLEATSVPGFTAPPHIHHGNDELFYVLDGEFEFLVGDRTYTATPGSFVFVPRGTVHAPRVVGPEPGKVLIAFVPGGQERAFDEFARLAAERGGPVDHDDPELLEIVRRFDSELVEVRP